MVVVRGELHFEDSGVSLAGAKVYVRLLDVSRADAPAHIISEYKIPSLPVGVDTSKSIPFEFKSDLADPRRSYTITAHIDMDGDGRVSAGDYITMENFSVVIDVPSTQHVVRVRKVKS